MTNEEFIQSLEDDMQEMEKDELIKFAKDILCNNTKLTGENKGLREELSIYKGADVLREATYPNMLNRLLALEDKLDEIRIKIQWIQENLQIIHPSMIVNTLEEIQILIGKKK